MKRTLQTRPNRTRSFTTHLATSTGLVLGGLLLGTACNHSKHAGGEAPMRSVEKSALDERQERWAAEKAFMKIELDQLFAEGSITQEQAAQRMAEFERRQELEMSMAGSEDQDDLHEPMIQDFETEDHNETEFDDGAIEHIANSEEEVRAKLLADYEAKRGEMRAAVLAGTLSKEEAEKGLQAYQAGINEKLTGRAVMHREGLRIREQVAAGTLTQKEARKQLADVRARIGKQGGAAEVVDPRVGQSDHRTDPGQVIRRIQAAEKAGEITPEQARKRIGEYRRGLEAAALAEELALIEAGIAEQVNSGAISAEEGAEFLELSRRARAGKVDLGERKDTPDAPQSGQEGEVQNPQEVHGSDSLEEPRSSDPSIARIQDAVREGRLSSEEGRKMMAVHRQKIADKKAARLQSETDAMIKKVEEAVKAGELTPEQARIKLEAYRKSMKKRIAPKQTKALQRKGTQAAKESVKKDS